MKRNITAGGHPTLPEARGIRSTSSNSTNNATVAINSTALLDESKITIIVCTKAKCGSDMDCYCCMNYTPEVCFATMDNCRSYCPVCHPVCPPLAQTSSHQPLVREDRPSHVTNQLHPVRLRGVRM
ncbi:hypothetical protein HU200_010655 [Digitaria exilis]|uniref:Uncharacterized protein n=1 Tax=Digitaria exilis TaxID=1010633 RepID=A0A835FHW6_9POAL|nr:hypothetical protein HU200_010655 [Digitaria exilis]